ncbi:MAG: hypothetical protein AB7R67_20160 [Vicinamibacterales bacterium]
MSIALKLTRPVAWAPEAIVEAGVPAAQVRTLLADGPRAVPERPRLSVDGRRRGEPTTRYVWGPDLRVLLS